MHFYMPRSAEKARLGLQRLIIGSCCVFCNRRGEQNRDVCIACEQLFVRRVFIEKRHWVNFLCSLCGEEHRQFMPEDEFPDQSDENRRSKEPYFCQKCQLSNALFVRVLAPYRYEFPLDRIIQRMKYGQQRVLGRVLGSLLASHVGSDHSLPDIVLSVPLHPSRQISRGYNQAADIARWCARELGIAHKPLAVSRVFDTGSLAGLSKPARQLRILGAFRASDEVRGLRIAIVDDVLTTGATTRELARELYDSGAESVEVWVLARTSSSR